MVVLKDVPAARNLFFPFQFYDLNSSIADEIKAFTDNTVGPVFFVNLFPLPYLITIQIWTLIQPYTIRNLAFTST